MEFTEGVRFDSLHLSPEIIRAIEKRNIEVSTPVQAGCIPPMMDWQDVIAKAPTGTGKTFAYGIPIVEHVDPEDESVQAVILAPTRELAIQITDEIRDLAAFKPGVRTVCLYGGAPIGRQIDTLKKHPQIVVATPGRLSDHMKRRTVRADEQNKPDIQQYRIEVERGDKTEITARLLEAGSYERAIAFCNTKNMTDRLSGLLKMRGFSAEAIHGDIQQSVREKTLNRFRRGELRVLVATDVAARGLDIDDVDVVFNYDVPDENEYYVHRIGRTGRAKRHGVAYTLVSTITESMRMDDIEKATKNKVHRLKYEKGTLLDLEEGK